VTPGCVKTSEVPKPREWFSEIAQTRPDCDPRRDFFYQFSTPPRFYTAKTLNGPKCSLILCDDDISVSGPASHTVGCLQLRIFLLAAPRLRVLAAAGFFWFPRQCSLVGHPSDW